MSRNWWHQYQFSLLYISLLYISIIKSSCTFFTLLVFEGFAVNVWSLRGKGKSMYAKVSNQNVWETIWQEQNHFFWTLICHCPLTWFEDKFIPYESYRMTHTYIKETFFKIKLIIELSSNWFFSFSEMGSFRIRGNFVLASFKVIVVWILFWRCSWIVFIKNIHVQE